MDPTYSAQYRHIYEHHWWWRAREAYVLTWLRRLRPVGGFGPILDVGCGDGLLFPKLRTLGEPEGLEPDGSLVTNHGRQWGTIHVQPFDASFQSTRRYGLILMLDVLEHLDDPLAALGHARDLLAGDGPLVLTVPAFNLLWTAHDDLNRHRTRYTRTALTALLRRAEMRVQVARYFFTWTVAAKLWVRLKERLAPTPPELPAIPPPWINRALYGLSRADHLLGHLIPLPVGSSLFVVARREGRKR